MNVKLIDTIDELLNATRIAEKFFLFGAGLYGRYLELFLEQNDISIDSYIVSKNGKERTWRNIQIRSVEEVQLKENEMVLLSVSEKNEKEILETLEAKGISAVYTLSSKMWNYVRENIDFERITSISPDKPVQVLIFHRVSYKKNDPWHLEVTPEIFEEYMKKISSHYNLIRFDDNWNEIKEKSVVITFDDGYFDNYYYAFPILEKYNIPFTIFVSTGNVGTDREFWWDRLARIIPEEEIGAVRQHLLKLSNSERDKEINLLESKQLINTKLVPSPEDRSMSRNELYKIAQSPLMTVGAHTVSHSMLSALSKEEQEEEIRLSREYLENIVEKPITVFSYPFGGQGTYNNETIDILKRNGFSKAATNFNGLTGPGCEMYEIPRCGIPENTNHHIVEALEKNWVIYG